MRVTFIFCSNIHFEDCRPLLPPIYKPIRQESYNFHKRTIERSNPKITAISEDTRVLKFLEFSADLGIGGDRVENILCRKSDISLPCHLWLFTDRSVLSTEFNNHKRKPMWKSWDHCYEESVVQRCSVKKLLLEISQNSQGNTCARASFLIKLQAWRNLYDNKYMIASTQITKTGIFAFISVLVLKLLSGEVLLTNRKRQ